jgi:hypothetical protein
MKQRRIAAVLTGSVMAAAMGAFVAPMAQADPGTQPEQVTPTEQTQAVKYWTTQRMLSAKAVAIDSSGVKRATQSEPVQIGAKRVIKAASASNKQTRAQGAPVTGTRWTGGGKVVKTTGKVFFTVPAGEPGAGDYVCSGSVAPANNKSVIITAGHCVNDANEHQAQGGDGRPGHYVENWVFVPGYNHGNTPYGVYPATRLLAGSPWVRDADFNYDVGFATVGGQEPGRNGQHSNLGALVANEQGSQSLGFNLPRHQWVQNYGYPAAAPYGGEELDYSAGAAINADENGASHPGNSSSVDDPNGSHDQVIKSNLTGGSSGGPWFYNFNDAKGTGTQVSVNSFSYEGLSASESREFNIPRDNMWGPYFGTAIEKLYDSVQGAAPTADNKSATTPEETAVKVALSGTNPNADPTRLKFKITKQPAHGTVSLSGSIATYKPAKNFNGIDTFSYVTNNGVSNSAPATVRIRVTPVNDAPVAKADSYQATENQALDVKAPGVLKNDTDADGDTLSVDLTQTVQPKHGTLDLRPNGGFSYVPKKGFSGQDQFSYVATDGVTTSSNAQLVRRTRDAAVPLAASNQVTVTIDVQAAAQKPTPSPTPTPSPSPSEPPTASPTPTQPPASVPPSEGPNGPLGDTGSPFSPTVIGFGLFSLAAGIGTLIVARKRR